jgi:hypothetical protein
VNYRCMLRLKNGASLNTADGFRINVGRSERRLTNLIQQKG